MMIVVVLRTHQERQMVAGVRRQRVLDDVVEPESGSYHVAPHERDAQHRRNHIAEYVLDGVRVNGRPRNRGGKFVMFLVDDFVQVLVVQQSMAVVETNLPHEHANDKVPHDGRQRRKNSDIWQVLVDRQVKTDVRQGSPNDELVEQDRFDDLDR